MSSGVELQYMRIRSIDFTPLFPCDHDGNGSGDVFNSWLDFKDNAFYIGAPLDVRYDLFSGSNKFYIRTGIDVLLNAFTIHDGHTIECRTDPISTNASNSSLLSRFLVLGNVGLGLETEINGKSYFIEPRIGYNLSDIFQTASISVLHELDLLSIGVRVGGLF